MIRQSFAAMTTVERHRVSLMYASILALHLLGFGVFIAFVIPAHYRGLGIGVSVLAYTLGLRHAFDADHIAVIDNTTRKEMNERQGTGRPRPFCFGYFFSLGHSSVVVAMGIGIVVAEKFVFGEVLHSGSGLQQFGTVIGTLVSAGFLFLIGGLNLVILSGIVKVFRAMRRGEYDEAELERQLDNRGFFYRFFGRWMRAISKEWHLYPVGFLFGLGFDTTTEVLLLGTTAFLALQHIPWYAICCLPLLFTAGMALMDTTDCIFMNLAYGWAFFNPVRKVYYNLAITGPVGRHLLHGRRHRDSRPDLHRGQGAEPGWRVLGLHARLQHQRRGVRHRRAVHPDLAGRIADLAIRPHRGEVERALAGRARTREGQRAALTLPGSRC